MYSNKVYSGKLILYEEDSIILGADGKPLEKTASNKSQISDSGRKSIFAPQTINAINDTQTQFADDAFTKASPKQRVQRLIVNGNSESFPNFKDYGSAFRASILDSVNKYGYYYDNNPYLYYADAVKNTPVAKLGASASTAFLLIEQLLRTNSLKINDLTIKWLTDSSSYNADDVQYKIKALAFLSSNEAKQYGDTSDVSKIIDSIKKERSKVKIMQLLDDWQSSDGNSEAPADSQKVQNDFKNVTKGLSELQKNISSDKNYLSNIFDKYYKNGDSASDVLGKVLNDLMKKSK